jgi:hypothetical protein
MTNGNADAWTRLLVEAIYPQDSIVHLLQHR